ncbi:MAG TPA: hypothetical protein VH480_21600 [Streptosporangiaceae bacterium]|jgi:hypothetical protein
MIRMIRLCPDCGWDRRFAPHHMVAGDCPDSPDGYCPEWSCTRCGAVLMIGLIPAWPGPAEVPVLDGPVLKGPVPQALVA